MVRQQQNKLLVLPWSEPAAWVYTDHRDCTKPRVCSVPDIHGNRSVASLIQSTLYVARQIKPREVIVSWEASAAVATRIAISLRQAKNPWVALGIIPKPINQRIVAVCLKRASVVTCFSNEDALTLQSTAGIHAGCVTPTVWHPTMDVATEKINRWVSVGASNRDDKTLAQAAEESGIVVDRFARKVTIESPALRWQINAPQERIVEAFQTSQYHLAILGSANYASGLSIAVRAGFAQQLLIASDTPHIRDVVSHGETGLLVRQGDSVHLASTIRSVVNGDVDVSKLSQRLREVCYGRHTYKQLRDHIEEMVAQCL